MPSAFINFSQSKRVEVVAANPKAKFGDIGKILGKMWQKLSDEEKAKYASTSLPKKKSKSSKKTAAVEVKEAAENKESAENKEVAENKEAADGEEAADAAESTKTSSNKTMSKKSKNSVTKKKRPLSAFIVFCNENRDQVKKENPNASFGEIGKILGKMWREKKGEK